MLLYSNTTQQFNYCFYIDNLCGLASPTVAGKTQLHQCGPDQFPSKPVSCQKRFDFQHAPLKEINPVSNIGFNVPNTLIKLTGLSNRSKEPCHEQDAGSRVWVWAGLYP